MRKRWLPAIKMHSMESFSDDRLYTTLVQATTLNWYFLPKESPGTLASSSAAMGKIKFKIYNYILQKIMDGGKA